MARTPIQQILVEYDKFRREQVKQREASLRAFEAAHPPRLPEPETTVKKPAGGRGGARSILTELALGALKGVLDIPVFIAEHVRPQSVAEIERLGKEGGLPAVISGKLPAAFERWYEEQVRKPTLEKFGFRERPTAYSIGEWLAPTALVSPLGSAALKAPKVAQLVSKVPTTVGKIATQAGVRAAVEAPLVWSVVEAPKPKEERAGLPETALYWAGGEAVTRLLGRLAQRALRARQGAATAPKETSEVVRAGEFIEEPLVYEEAKQATKPEEVEGITTQQLQTIRQLGKRVWKGKGTADVYGALREEANKLFGVNRLRDMSRVQADNFISSLRQRLQNAKPSARAKEPTLVNIKATAASIGLGDGDVLSIARHRYNVDTLTSLTPQQARELAGLLRDVRGAVKSAQAVAKTDPTRATTLLREAFEAIGGLEPRRVVEIAETLKPKTAKAKTRATRTMPKAPEATTTTVPEAPRRPPEQMTQEQRNAVYALGKAIGLEPQDVDELLARRGVSTRTEADALQTELKVLTQTVSGLRELSGDALRTHLFNIYTQTLGMPPETALLRAAAEAAKVEQQRVTTTTLTKKVKSTTTPLGVAEVKGVTFEIKPHYSSSLRERGVSTVWATYGDRPAIAIADVEAGNLGSLNFDELADKVIRYWARRDAAEQLAEWVAKRHKGASATINAVTHDVVVTDKSGRVTIYFVADGKVRALTIPEPGGSVVVGSKPYKVVEFVEGPDNLVVVDELGNREVFHVEDLRELAEVVPTESGGKAKGTKAKVSSGAKTEQVPPVAVSFIARNKTVSVPEDALNKALAKGGWTDDMAAIRDTFEAARKAAAAKVGVPVEKIDVVGNDALIKAFAERVGKTNASKLWYGVLARAARNGHLPTDDLTFVKSRRPDFVAYVKDSIGREWQVGGLGKRAVEESTSPPEGTLQFPAGNLLPGTTAWKRAVKENPQLDAEATKFWDNVRAVVAPDKDVAYVEDIERLLQSHPAFKDERNSVLGEVARQLKQRGVTIGFIEDRILDDLNLKAGSTVHLKDLVEAAKKHNYPPKMLVQAAERRGVTVEGDGVNLLGGLPQVPLLDKIMRHSATKPTFRPITEVYGRIGSLPEEDMAKLPTELRAVLEELDVAAYNANWRIRDLLRFGNLRQDVRDEVMRVVEEAAPLIARRQALQAVLDATTDKAVVEQTKKMIVEVEKELLPYSARIRALLVPSNLSPEAQKTFWELVEALANTSAEREKLRPQVEKILFDSKQRKFVESDILPRFTMEEVFKKARIGGIQLLRDARTKEVKGYMYVTPRKGERLFIPEAEPPTKADEQLLFSRLSWTAKALSDVRNVLGEYIVLPWRNASLMYDRFVKEYEEWLAEITKPLTALARKDPDVLSRVTYMLEGRLPMEGVEGQVAAKLREWFDDLFKQFGIDPDRYWNNYAPRIREAGSIKAAFGVGRRLPKELRFFAEMERTGLLQPRETNVITLALTYLRAGARKKFFEPVLQAQLPIYQRMVRRIGETDVTVPKAAYYEQFVNSVMNRPLIEEQLADATVDAAIKEIAKVFGKDAENFRLGGRRVLGLSAFVSRLLYLGTIGFNVRTGLVQLLQQILAVGTLDPTPGIGLTRGLQYWLKARQAMLSKRKEVKHLLNYCWVLQHRIFLEGLEAQVRLGKLQALQGAFSALQRSGFWFLRVMDYDGVRTAYLMKLFYDLDRGKPFAEAVNAANNFAKDTQFLYGMDSALWFKTPVGRIGGILMSYPVKYLDFLYQLHKNDPAGRVRVAHVLLLGIAVPWFLRKLLGLDFNTETPIETAEGWLPIATLKMATGEAWQGIPPAAQVLVNVWNSATNVYTGIKLNDPLLVEAAANDMKKSLALLLPGTVQRRRIERFINAALNDWKVYNERGQLQYEIPKEGLLYELTGVPGEAVRMVIGRTAMQVERGKELERIIQEEERYRRLRQAAVDAFLRGDFAAFARYQQEIIQRGGRPVDAGDIKRAIRYMYMTSTERAAMGLPRTYVLEGGK